MHQPICLAQACASTSAESRIAERRSPATGRPVPILAPWRVLDGQGSARQRGGPP